MSFRFSPSTARPASESAAPLARTAHCAITDRTYSTPPITDRGPRRAGPVIRVAARNRFGGHTFRDHAAVSRDGAAVRTARVRPPHAAFRRHRPVPGRVHA